MSVEEYKKLIEMLSPDWVWPSYFRTKEDAIRWYYINHRVSRFYSDLSTHELRQDLGEITINVNEYEYDEFLEHRKQVNELKKILYTQERKKSYETDFEQ